MELLTGRRPSAMSRLRLGEIDRQVAARVRTRRIVLGMTMQQLATMVGVTYQQLYKYESGTNRIAAARLNAMARALDVAPGYFFEDASELQQDEVTPERRQLLQLLRDFGAIPSRRLQAALCAVVRAVAATEPPDDSHCPADAHGPGRRGGATLAGPDAEKQSALSTAA